MSPDAISGFFLVPTTRQAYRVRLTVDIKVQAEQALGGPS